MRGSLAVPCLAAPHPEAATPAPSSDVLPGAISPRQPDCPVRKAGLLGSGVGELQERRAPPHLGPCMAGLFSLFPIGFELKYKARSCCSWNRSIYLAPGLLGVVAGRGVSLTPMSSHV